jgi:hypothetical protein
MKKWLRDYNIHKESFAPSMFGKNRLKFSEKSHIFVENAIEYQMVKIRDICLEKLENRQPVLIFFDDKKRLY